jgi:hypothetical protein
LGCLIATSFEIQWNVDQKPVPTGKFLNREQNMRKNKTERKKTETV